MNSRFRPRSFVVSAFSRCGTDYFARTLEKHGLLANYALGTRRGTTGVPPERTQLNPVFGLLNFMAAKCLPTFQAESFRFRLFALYDRWLASLLQPGQHLLTGFVFPILANARAKELGGLALIDAENTHPQTFWNLLTDEQNRWKSPYPPVAPHFIDRCVKSVRLCDYVFASSKFVQQSFLEQGAEPRRVLPYTLPIHLDWFKPAESPRPASRPLTLLNTGALCLRKGTPYLLEAYRLIRQQEPQAVLRVTRTVRNDAEQALRAHADLPLDWAPYFNLQGKQASAARKLYLERIQTSDVFVFPSIEDGFALVVAEAMACGLPVITTPNTGASDLIIPGENGEIVPIRDPQAIAVAVLKWWRKIRATGPLPQKNAVSQALSTETFEKCLLDHLAGIP